MNGRLYTPRYYAPVSFAVRKSSRERRFDRRRRVDGPRYPSARARVAIRRETIGQSGGKRVPFTVVPFSEAIAGRTADHSGPTL